MYYEKKFAENGYDTNVLSAGRDVLGYCRANKPDLILLDIVLSDTDGYSVAEQLRSDKSLPRIPIIFMTGQDLDVHEMANKSQRLGRCDFITKPCTFADALEKVRLFLPVEENHGHADTRL